MKTSIPAAELMSPGHLACQGCVRGRRDVAGLPLLLVIGDPPDTRVELEHQDAGSPAFRLRVLLVAGP